MNPPIEVLILNGRSKIQLLTSQKFLKNDSHHVHIFFTKAKNKVNYYRFPIGEKYFFLPKTISAFSKKPSTSAKILIVISSAMSVDYLLPYVDGSKLIRDWKGNLLTAKKIPEDRYRDPIDSRIERYASATGERTIDALFQTFCELESLSPIDELIDWKEQKSYQFAVFGDQLERRISHILIRVPDLNPTNQIEISLSTSHQYKQQQQIRFYRQALKNQIRIINKKFSSYQSSFITALASPKTIKESS